MKIRKTIMRHRSLTCGLNDVGIKKARERVTKLAVAFVDKTDFVHTTKMNEIMTNEVKSNMLELSLHIFFALTLHRLIYR